MFELAVFALANTTHMEDTDPFLPVFLTCGCVEMVRFLYEPALECIMSSIVPKDLAVLFPLQGSFWLVLPRRCPQRACFPLSISAVDSNEVIRDGISSH